MKINRIKNNYEPYWDSVKRIISESDVVLEVLDARLVELSRNKEVEKLIEEINRPIIFVINKSDLISKKRINDQIIGLREKGPVVYVSTKNKKSIKILTQVIKDVFKKYGRAEVEFTKGKPRFKKAIGELVVGVVGYPNVGKSRIINSLAHKTKVKVSKKAGTTHGVHWVKMSGDIMLIDTPGVIPLKSDDEIRYGLIGARNAEKMKNLSIVANAIIKLFLKDNINEFEEFYNIQIVEKDYDSIIEQIGKLKNFLLKGGIVDEHRTETMIIKDWQEGRLKIY